MSFNNSTPLLIYKASAGSGKTFTLTKEYIKLLFSVPKNETKLTPCEVQNLHEDAFKHILAVTFTKKATAEMKQRIIKEIGILSTNATKSSYIEEIKDIMTHSIDFSSLDSPEINQFIEQRATKILRTILNDYSNFSVKTIDAFFQKILRAFARDLGLNDEFTIEMDTESVLESSIDSCLSHLEIQSPEGISVKEMILEKIRDQKSWNPRKDITSLARELFKEAYHSNAKELENIDFTNIIKDISKSVKLFEDRVKTHCDNMNTIPGIENITFKRGLDTKFEKIKKDKFILKTTFLKIADNIDIHNNDELVRAFSDPVKWMGKIKAKKDPNANALLEGTFAKNAASLYLLLHPSNPELVIYNSQLAVKNKIHVLSLLNSINAIIAQQMKESNKQLISNTNELINHVIHNCKTPFIYEKTGIKIDHYFIDEFQDTSNMQWNNFKPLLQGSLGTLNTNLLVGDVKQSIYRWRSSDYRILYELDKDTQLKSFINARSMTTNWRSTDNIIKFNNVLFTCLINNYKEVDNEASKSITSIYNDVNQYPNHNTKNHNNGLIRIFSPIEEAKKIATFKELMLNQMVKEIDFLITQKNYQFSNLMILVRKNSEAQDVVKYLMQQSLSNGQKIPLISNEALMIKNSQAVQLIITSLRYILNPDESIQLANLLMIYEVCKKVNTTEIINPIEHIDIEDIHNYKNESINNIKNNVLSYANYPLFKIIESLILFYELSTIESELPYLMAFQDIILEFTKNNSSDIYVFLTNWDNYYANNKSLAAPNDLNAVQILSIHKSKGLESRAVFIPFLNWELKPKPGSILWSSKKNQSSEYNSPLPITPIGMTSKLKNTIFEKEYLEEEMNTQLDVLNLTYVAFTRSAEYLYIGIPRCGYAGDSAHMGDLIMEVVNNLNESSKVLQNQTNTHTVSETQTDGKYLYSIPNCESDEVNVSLEDIEEEIPLTCYSIGKLNPLQEIVESSAANDTINLEYPSYSLEDKKRPGLQLKGSSNYWDAANSAKNYGTMMHDCLSHIFDAEDLTDAAHLLFTRSLITEKEEELIVEELQPILQDKDVAPWFKPENYHRILREKALYCKPLASYKNQTEFRPDRVLIKDDEAIIIDYKFGKQSRHHIQQVEAYKEIFKNKGFNASGYLLYIKEKKATIVKV